MSKKNTINGAAYQMDYGADYIVGKYQSDGYEAQKLTFEEDGNNGRLVQIRNTSDGVGGKLKALVGLKTCATLKLLQRGGDLEIEVFGGSWLDKGAVVAVSWFVLWPLLITGSVGAFKQKKLLDKVYDDTLCYFAGSRSN
ncbi:MAG: hypothetical protein IKP58_16790 [Victivallales bacterium]|nr:hypothetical protein [Victivallales bacterium]MBR6059827.1 hypothetical protein [Victivallales bacterium]